MLRNITNQGGIMYLPKTYENFTEKFSKVTEAYQNLGKEIGRAHV